MKEHLRKRMRHYVKRMKPEWIVEVPIEKCNYWCGLPYRGHPKGCPNYLGRGDKRNRICKNNATHNEQLSDLFDLDKPVWVVWAHFDVDEQERRMKERWPDWTVPQCRNLRLWQSSLVSVVKAKSIPFAIKQGPEYVIITSGFGLNVYASCRRAGIRMDLMRELRISTRAAFIIAMRPHVDPAMFKNNMGIDIPDHPKEGITKWMK